MDYEALLSRLGALSYFEEQIRIAKEEAQAKVGFDTSLPNLVLEFDKQKQNKIDKALLSFVLEDTESANIAKQLGDFCGRKLNKDEICGVLRTGEGDVAGVILGRNKDILALWVCPSFRGYRIGRLLVMLFEQRVRERQKQTAKKQNLRTRINSLKVYVDALQNEAYDASPFWRKMGYLPNAGTGSSKFSKDIDIYPPE